MSVKTKKQRMSDEIFFTYDGYEKHAHGRADMYHTAEEFEKAALAVFEYDQAGPGQIVGEPKKRLVRINPASPDIQDQMGFSFILDYPSRPQRGAWMSWNVRMKYG